jgi:hypothetical protein
MFLLVLSAVMVVPTASSSRCQEFNTTAMAAKLTAQQASFAASLYEQKIGAVMDVTVTVDFGDIPE